MGWVETREAGPAPRVTVTKFPFTALTKSASPSRNSIVLPAVMPVVEVNWKVLACELELVMA